MATLLPNERYAFVGKTRSGKTYHAMVVAGTLALALYTTTWQVWLITTKGSADDLVGWRKWGFRNIASQQDRATSLLPNALYFIVSSKDANGQPLSIEEQCQGIFDAAYERGNVIVVVDEYVSVVASRQNPGTSLKDIFQRGGGRTVGLIGLTQEPVYVPRQLVSQATHIFLFTLTYSYDIEWARKICKEYVPPADRGHPHGFWYKWVDGPTNRWRYYEHQKEWYDELRIALPRPAPVPEQGLQTEVW